MAAGDAAWASTASRMRPPAAPTMKKEIERGDLMRTSKWVAEDNVGPGSLARIRDVDAPEHVGVDPHAQPGPRRVAHAPPRRHVVAVDLAGRHERIDAPVGDHTEHAGAEQADALLGLHLPGGLVDEAILGEAAQEELAAQAGLVVERDVVAADQLRPVQA